MRLINCLLQCNLFKGIIVDNWVVLYPAGGSNCWIATAFTNSLRLVFSDYLDVSIGILDYWELIVLHGLENASQFLLSLFDISKIFNCSVSVLPIFVFPRMRR